MITLYDAARCPYCARVRIVLAEKGVEVETVEIDLSDRPAWLYEKNATGRVPVIEEDGRPLPESAVIMEFLEECYPEPALLPADRSGRAYVRLLIFRDHELTDPYYAFRRGEEGAREELEAMLAALDVVLGERPFLGGAEYGLADIAYIPWLLRARDMLAVDLHGFPSLGGWLSRLEERPSIAAEAGIVAAL
ncbi:MAG TPA: glutathione S-transferase family protein [Gaiellaceae bacterium]|nr:glutathione S-transferase family protein [Gaiellaceae bacterium]